jgi:hypothetical protein
MCGKKIVVMMGWHKRQNIRAKKLHAISVIFAKQRDATLRDPQHFHA